MKIRCISDSAQSLPEELIYPELGLRRDSAFALTVGAEYVVYGLTFYLGHLWYYICDEDYTYYPVWNPDPLFRIVDNRLSSFWRIGVLSIGAGRTPLPMIAFEEWVSSQDFYDRLTDGQADAVAIFSRYKQLIDQESGLG